MDTNNCENVDVQQPTSVVALESGTVPEPGGYCSANNRGQRLVPTTSSWGVRATGKSSKIITIVSIITLAYYGFIIIAGGVRGPFYAGHVLASVMGIWMGKKVRRSSSKCCYTGAALLFALGFAINVLFLVYLFAVTAKMAWNARNIEGYDIPVWVMAFLIVPDMLSAASFLAGSASAFVAICNWQDKELYEVGDAETPPV